MLGHLVRPVPVEAGKGGDGVNEIDNPHVRADAFCPLCEGVKGAGLVCCWPCYRREGMRNGNPKAEAAIARRNELLRRHQTV